MRKKGNKGFTLVELLVVIAIIGILAVVAVPALFKNINKAKIADVEADYNAVKSSMLSYYADNNDFTTNLAELKIEGFNKQKSAVGGVYEISKKAQDDNTIKDVNNNRIKVFKIDANGNTVGNREADKVNLDSCGDIFLTIQGQVGNTMHINDTQFKKLVDDIGNENIYLFSTTKGTGFKYNQIFIRLANNMLPEAPKE